MDESELKTIGYLCLMAIGAFGLLTTGVEYMNTLLVDWRQVEIVVRGTYRGPAGIFVGAVVLLVYVFLIVVGFNGVCKSTSK